MSTPLVALILGSGPRIGAAVATKLIGNGYHVAIVSRKGETGGIKGVLALQADFAEQWDVAAVYDAVEAEFQAPPSVVIYNAAALTPPATPTSLLSIPAEKFRSDLSVNAISPYLAAQEAVRRWEAMPDRTQKTFIYTGNAQNVLTIPVPAMLNLGVGKSASAYWIGVADGFYSSKGYRFYYADERQEDGKLKGAELDGPAHGDFYAQLVAHKNIPWHATFVKGRGYVAF